MIHFSPKSRSKAKREVLSYRGLWGPKGTRGNTRCDARIGGDARDLSLTDSCDGKRGRRQGVKDTSVRSLWTNTDKPLYNVHSELLKSCIVCHTRRI
jgi:hypothetical protein